EPLRIPIHRIPLPFPLRRFDSHSHGRNRTSVHSTVLGLLSKKEGASPRFRSIAAGVVESRRASSGKLMKYNEFPPNAPVASWVRAHAVVDRNGAQCFAEFQVAKGAKLQAQQKGLIAGWLSGADFRLIKR